MIFLSYQEWAGVLSIWLTSSCLISVLQWFCSVGSLSLGNRDSFLDTGCWFARGTYIPCLRLWER